MIGPAEKGDGDIPLLPARVTCASAWCCCLAFAAAYFTLAWLGRALSNSTDGFVSVWLPSGLYVAGLVLSPFGAWPRMIAAALLANAAFDLSNQQPWPRFVLFSLVNTAAAIPAASLIKRFADRPDLRSVRGVVALTAMGGLLSMGVSATLGTLALGSSAALDWRLAWLRWWSGDFLGLILVAPLLLAMPNRRHWRPLRLSILAEGALLTTFLAGCSALMFGTGLAPSLTYVLIPCVMWAGFRVGVWGVAWCNLAISITAFAVDAPAQAQAPPLQFFLGVLAISGLSTAAAVTERNRAEAALRKSQERYALVESASNDGIWDWNLRDGTAYISPRAKELLGYSDSELRNHESALLSLLHPDERASATESLRAHLQSGRRLCSELRLRHKDGSFRWMLVRGQAQRDSAGCPVRLTGAISDVTERKEAEFQARERQFQYHAMANSGMALVWTSGPDKLCDYFNEIWLKFTGRKLEQELGNGWTESVHPDDLARCVAIYEKAFEARVPFEMEYRLRHHSGEYRWILDLGSPNYHSDGSFAGYIGHCFDVTESRTAKAALLTSEAELRAIYDGAPIMLGLLDQSLTLVRANLALASAAKRTPEQLAGLSATEVIMRVVNTTRAVPDLDARDDALEEVRALFEDVLATGAPIHRAEVQVCPNGPFTSPLVLLFSGSRLELGGKPYALMCVEDLTKEKQLEAQFYQSQKVEAIGQLAGGIAHDFNNILAAFMMHLSLLSESVPLPPDSAECVEELTREAKRASALTRQLLMFSRRQIVQFVPVDVQELLANLGNMLRRIIGEHIRLQLPHAVDALLISADPGMIEQLVTNLCVNARDAMPQGGTLSITTERLFIEAPDPTLGPNCRAGSFVRLRVSDTGCGMHREVLNHIFEPFFTTKPHGKGTGLGLATVAGIVKQHHGWVTVDSAPGRGTTFDVFLPLASHQTSLSSEKEPHPALPRGSETILVVEDEPGLRRAIAQNLRRCGYAVLEADNGDDGLSVWATHRHRIELLVTDMVMPGSLTGLELAQRLQQDAPGLPVLISSGYSSELLNGQTLSRSGFTFIAKPCEPKRLLRAVRDLLDSRKTASC